MSTASVQTRGIDALRTRVADMAERADKPEPVLVAQAALLRGVIVRGFSRSRGPNDEVWPALKQRRLGTSSSKPGASKAVRSKTRAAKARRGKKRKRPPGKPLLDTSLLRRSVVTKADGDGIVFGVTGARRVAAPTHQFGDARRNISPRPFLPMDRQGNALFTRGPAATWMKRAKAALTKYMLRGEA